MDGTNGVREEIVYLSNDWKNAAGYKPAAFDFAENLIIFLTLLPILLLPIRILNSDALTYFSIVLVPADLILLTCTRRKTKKLGFFILFLIIISVCVIALSVICVNYGAAVFALIAAIVSCKKLKDTLSRQEKNLDRDVRTVAAVYMNSKVVIVGAVICYLIYMISLALNFKDLMLFCVADYIADFAVMLIYRHKSGAFCLSQWNKTEENGNSSGQWEGKSKVTSAMFIFWTIAGVCIIALLVILTVNLSGINRIDEAIIKRLISFGTDYSNAVPPQKTTPVSQPSDLGKMLKDGQQKPILFLTILFELLQILGYLIAIFAGVLIIVAISRAIIGFYKKLHLSINEESRSLFSIDDTVTSLKDRIHRMSRSWDDFAHGGNRMRIRRLFFSYVKRHGTGTIVKSSDSPLEISGKVGSKAGRDMSDAAKIYEKARYAYDECSSDDVKNMKKSLTSAGSTPAGGNPRKVKR